MHRNEAATASTLRDLLKNTHLWRDGATGFKRRLLCIRLCDLQTVRNPTNLDIMRDVDWWEGLGVRVDRSSF